MPRTTQSRKFKPTIQISCEPKLGLAQKPYIGDAQLALLWGSPTNLWFNRDLRTGKMSERRSGDHAENGSVGSSRGSTWRE